VTYSVTAHGYGRPYFGEPFTGPVEQAEMRAALSSTDAAGVTPDGKPEGPAWPYWSSDSNSGVGCLAGRLEDHATPNLDRVVGEALIKPAQQRNIYGGLHTVRPFLLFEQSE
jgi:hypothetical protein